jgi:hypothetical protein
LRRKLVDKQIGPLDGVFIESEEEQQWPLDEQSIDGLATDRLPLKVNNQPTGTGIVELLSRASEEKLVAPGTVQTCRVTRKGKSQCEHTFVDSSKSSVYSAF